MTNNEKFNLGKKLFCVFPQNSPYLLNDPIAGSLA